MCLVLCAEFRGEERFFARPESFRGKLRMTLIPCALPSSGAEMMHRDQRHHAVGGGGLARFRAAAVARRPGGGVAGSCRANVRDERFVGIGVSGAAGFGGEAGEGAGEELPVAAELGEGVAAGGGDGVVAAVAAGDVAAGGVDPAFALEGMEQGIERTFAELKGAAGSLGRLLAQAVGVARSVLEGIEDDECGDALLELS